MPEHGGLAQLGEHLLCKQGVVGSIPSSSTTVGRQASEDRDRESVEFKGKPGGLPLNLAKAEGEMLFNKKEEGKVAYGR